jgi:ankyrin repeat protein
MDDLNVLLEQCEGGNKEPLASWVENHGVDFLLGDQTALGVACVCGNELSVALLLSLGANPNSKSAGTVASPLA